MSFFRFSRRAVLSALVLSLPSCDYFEFVTPRVDIQVAREGDKYRFSFETCRGDIIGIPYISIKEYSEKGPASHTACLLWAEPSVPKIEGDWYYGEVPPGYELQRCEPLKRGVPYEITVTGAGGGRRLFSLRADGSVELGAEGACR